jgi:hypothetical protein
MRRLIRRKKKQNTLEDPIKGSLSKGNQHIQYKSGISGDCDFL